MGHFLPYLVFFGPFCHYFIALFPTFWLLSISLTWALAKLVFLWQLKESCSIIHPHFLSGIPKSDLSCSILEIRNLGIFMKNSVSLNDFLDIPCFCKFFLWAMGKQCFKYMYCFLASKKRSPQSSKDSREGSPLDGAPVLFSFDMAFLRRHSVSFPDYSWFKKIPFSSSNTICKYLWCIKVSLNLL